MTVTVELTGYLADQVGEARRSVELNKKTTLDVLLAKLALPKGFAYIVTVDGSMVVRESFGEMILNPESVVRLTPMVGAG